MKKFLELLILSAVLFSGCGQFLNEQFNLGGDCFSIKDDKVVYSYNGYTKSLYVYGNNSSELSIPQKMQDKEIKSICIRNINLKDKVSINYAGITNLQFENSTFTNPIFDKVNSNNPVIFSECKFYKIIDSINEEYLTGEEFNYNENNNYYFADCNWLFKTENNSTDYSFSIYKDLIGAKIGQGYCCISNGTNIYMYGIETKDFDDKDVPWINYLNKKYGETEIYINISESIEKIRNNTFNINGTSFHFGGIKFLGESKLSYIASCAFAVGEGQTVYEVSNVVCTEEGVIISSYTTTYKPEITIPSSVKEIQGEAFKNWDENCTITLDWSSDSNGNRTLTGLNDCGAKIVYNDGNEYEKQ